MTGLMAPDRWTCPTCGDTEVPDARDGDAMRQAIRGAQERHAGRHRAGGLAEMLERDGGVR